MPDDRTRMIETLFHEAMERAPDERDGFLEDACRGDEELKAEVRSLIAALEEEPDFLDKPGWSAFVRSAATDGGDEKDLEPEPGLAYDRLGEFRLIRRLGEGGMGIVYLAVQESLNRRVALKVIRPERMGAFEAEMRFSREVEAISELRNPGIVTVYGSGEDQGVRWFAMEYVPGRGLDEVLRRAASEDKKVPIARSLEWLGDIARALDCAHRAGIIHRDVKPSNIQITPEGRAMLLDFGVARHANLATLTLTGDFRGTPNYASPEQVKAKRVKIDARTDVYSLGVTLYEAATGRIPFKGETTEQVFHQILEEDPISPARLNPMISRDMDTVIVKAMEKDAALRYQTCAALAEEIDRLLRGEMILAKPAGFRTRTLKRIKRHPVLSTALGAAAAAAAVIVLYILWSYPQIVRERNRAEKESRAALAAKAETEKEMSKALSISNFLHNMLSSADPGRDGRAVKVVDVMDKAVADIAGAFPDQPEVEASLRNTIGMTYRVLGIYDEAELQARAVLEIRGRVLGAEHPETLIAMNNLAAVLSDLGRLDEAEAMHREVLDVSRRVLEKEDPLIIASMINLASMMKDQGRLEEAIVLAEEALESSRRIQGEEHRSTLAAMTNLAGMLRISGELPESERLHREALEIKLRVLGGEHPDTLSSLFNLGNVLTEQGRLPEAETAFSEVVATSRRILGDRHPDTIARMHNFALVLDEQGKLDKAEAAFAEVLELSRNALGDRHPDTLSYINSLAFLYDRQGRYADAEELYRQAVEIAEEVLPPEHFYLALFRMNLGEVLVKTERYSEAERLLLESLPVFMSSGGERPEHSLYTLRVLVRLYESWDRPEKAAEYKEMIRAAEGPPSDSSPPVDGNPRDG